MIIMTNLVIPVLIFSNGCGRKTESRFFEYALATELAEPSRPGACAGAGNRRLLRVDGYALTFPLTKQPPHRPFANGDCCYRCDWNDDDHYQWRHRPGGGIDNRSDQCHYRARNQCRSAAFSGFVERHTRRRTCRSCKWTCNHALESR